MDGGSEAHEKGVYVSQFIAVGDVEGEVFE